MRTAIACFLAVSVVGCHRAGPEPIAYQNRTFYEYGSLGAVVDPGACEQPRPPLDVPAQGGAPSYLGYATLGGIVQFSRPEQWRVRDCGNSRGRHHTQYVSHNQYVVAIWERNDLEADLWQDVLARYAEDVKATGGKIVGGPIPIATYNSQGRQFIIRRAVPAPKTALVGHTREYLLRSERHVVLVQVAIPESELPDLSTELLPFLTSVRVD